MRQQFRQLGDIRRSPCWAGTLRVAMIAISPVLMAHMGIEPVSIGRCDEGGERKQRDH